MAAWAWRQAARKNRTGAAKWRIAEAMLKHTVGLAAWVPNTTGEARPKIKLEPIKGRAMGITSEYDLELYCFER